MLNFAAQRLPHLHGSIRRRRSLMNKNFFAVVSSVALVSALLNSCDTPEGQGAGYGAATGAIIGAAATGNVRGAAIGAAAGAAAGALIGRIVQENQAAQYGPPRRVVFHTHA